MPRWRVATLCVAIFAFVSACGTGSISVGTEVPPTSAEPTVAVDTAMPFVAPEGFRAVGEPGVTLDGPEGVKIRQWVVAQPGPIPGTLGATVTVSILSGDEPSAQAKQLADGSESEKLDAARSIVSQGTPVLEQIDGRATVVVRNYATVKGEDIGLPNRAIVLYVVPTKNGDSLLQVIADGVDEQTVTRVLESVTI